MKEFSPDQMSNLVPSSDPTLSNYKIPDWSSQTSNPLLHQEEELLIPGMNISNDIAEVEECLEKNTPAKDDLTSPEPKHDLGELRFAEDD